MKTILVTAYAVNPNKGSEDGMGWNFILQIARRHRVIAVTRKNNRPAIENYLAAHPELNPQQERIQFLYFDWPQWSIRWKKGPLLSLIYFYLWQFTLALWLKKQHLVFDVVHNLNFHNNWTPTFLWLLQKPLVWGPVGHHPKIPKAFLLPYGKKEMAKDRFLWLLKKAFWTADPFLYWSRKKAAHVLCMNTAAAGKLRLTRNYSVMPSVASEAVEKSSKATEGFNLLSVGRFVPLKGFDVTLKAFAHFYHGLSKAEQQTVSLTLAGSGPYKTMLRAIVEEQGISNAVTIIEWMPREALAGLYQAASVFLFPSHEGAGMVVAEAMSYGLPVVCWNNCGPGEFVSPSTSLKVDYAGYDDSIKTFSSHLKKLFTDPVLYQKESSLALEQFQQHFQWNVRGNRLQSVYNAVLQANPEDQPSISFAL